MLRRRLEQVLILGSNPLIPAFGVDTSLTLEVTIRWDDRRRFRSGTGRRSLLVVWLSGSGRPAWRPRSIRLSSQRAPCAVEVGGVAELGAQEVGGVAELGPREVGGVAELGAREVGGVAELGAREVGGAELTP
jgi:hypothetical protein